MTTLTHLECSQCARQYDAGEPHGVCECGGPLFARYDLELARTSWNREWIRSGPESIWRWAPVLPVRKPASIVSLGEGMTPLIRAEKLGGALGLRQLWIKDESLNPTGSFKARGLSCAVSMANELGIRKVALPSAGNAASAMAAYAAAAGMEAHVFMPASTPLSNYLECKAFGARVTQVAGDISDSARAMAEGAGRERWFDMSTFREPYRLEGKKTMAYELADQMGWQPPAAILYPTGGGVGLIGMWKAFQELEQLGWSNGKPPRVIAVQAAGCAPVVRAFERGASEVERWADPCTVASGLRVPKPLAGSLMLKVLRETGGTAVAVTDEELLDAGLELARTEGIFAAPEGAACFAALPKLVASGLLDPDERVVVFNTGAGIKYAEAYSTRLPRRRESEQDKLGGLITPR